LIKKELIIFRFLRQPDSIAGQYYQRKMMEAMNPKVYFQPPMLSSCVVYGFVPESICRHYDSAGVFVYTVTDDGKRLFLTRKLTSNDKVAWSSVFGGKKLEKESPLLTAMRYFHEKSQGLFQVNDYFKIQETISDPNCKKFFLMDDKEKYLLYFLNVDYREVDAATYQWLPLEELEKFNPSDSATLKIGNKSYLFTGVILRYFAAFGFAVTLRTLRKGVEGEGNVGSYTHYHSVGHHRQYQFLDVGKSVAADEIGEELMLPSQEM
jgi:hypothetical protein